MKKIEEKEIVVEAFSKNTMGIKGKRWYNIAGEGNEETLASKVGSLSKGDKIKLKLVSPNEYEDFDIIKKAGARGPEKIKAAKETPVKKDSKVKDLVETDVDKLYELVRDKGIVKLNEASKAFKIDSEVIEEWGRILEEHKLVRLRYPPVGEPVLILKKFTSDTEEIKNLKGKKLKPKRRVFIINFVILACFIALVAFYTIKIPAIRITYFQAYLAVALIIIIGIVLIWRMRKRKKNASKGKPQEK